MRQFRVSVRGLMVLIVLLGIAFAGLRSPTPLWANGLVLAGSGDVDAGGAGRRVPPRRAAGVLGGIRHLRLGVLRFDPGALVPDRIRLPALHDNDSRLLAPYIVQKEDLVRVYVGSFKPPSSPVPPTPWQTWNLPEFPPENPWRVVGYVTLVSPGLYLRIGHSVFCMLIAFLGGEVVRYLAVTRSQPAATERRS